jgi:glutathione synthase/RimK-type ligase-like ATP-grasp enzyme
LCARVRVEEKQLMAALAEAGALPRPLPPSPMPLPVEPSPTYAGLAAGANVVIDRYPDRHVAAAILTVCRNLGATVIDAGLASRSDRLAVAGALAAAGLPRPATLLSCSDEAAMVAVEELGYPATLLPLMPGTRGTVLIDRDTAEAVLEHRVVLGRSSDAITLLQAGAPTPRATVIVVDGHAIAVDGDGSWLTDDAIGLAEAAAAVVGAVVAGVEIALGDEGLLVWDVLPVPDFRGALSLTGTTAAGAIAAAAIARFEPDAVVACQPAPVVIEEAERWHDLRRGVDDGIAVTA